MKTKLAILIFSAASFIWSCTNETTKNSNAQIDSIQEEATIEAEETPPSITKAEVSMYSKEQINDWMKPIKAKYDRVIYYAETENSVFFYVGNGNFNGFDPRNSEWKNTGFIMGVVDQTGKVIVPIEFEKVFNPNGLIPNAFEVLNKNRVGLYSFEGKELAAVVYDDLYPSNASDAYVQARKDSQYGWIDKSGVFRTGSNAAPHDELCKMPVDSKLVLKWKMNTDNIIVLQHANEDYNYAGVLFAPSYIYNLGIGLQLYEMALNMDMGVEQVKTAIVETKTLKNKIKAFIVSIVESGLDPRDGYTNNAKNLVIVDDKMNKIEEITIETSTRYESNTNTSYKFISDDLLQIEIGGQNSAYKPYSIPEWQFYSFEENGKLKRLKTNRSFAFTKFVKIDKSYFQMLLTRPSTSEEIAQSGNNGNEGYYFQTNFEHLSIEDLDIMRNEIFAEYGYIFKNDKWKNYFSQYSWYKPSKTNVDDQLTEIDKYNIDVIVQMKKEMTGNEASYTKKEIIPIIAAG